MLYSEAEGKMWDDPEPPPTKFDLVFGVVAWAIIVLALSVLGSL